MALTAPPPLSSYTAPVEQTERIIILDSLRGIAILGILIMNIPGFGLPYVAVFDLTILNELSGANFKAWAIVEGIFEGSMRGLFSMLFGAGMILFISRLEKKNNGIIPAEIYFRRQLWLLFFGLINTYILLWFWDILFVYAVCGMLLFVFRRLPAKSLFIAAGICLILMTARENRDFYKDKMLIKEGEKISRLDTITTKLTAPQKEKLEALQEFKERSSPESKKKIYEKQLRNVLGSWSEVYEQNTSIGVKGHTIVLYYFLIWDVLIFMFLGMAFFKTGILTGSHTVKTYLLLTIAGLSIGLLLSWLRLSEDLHYNFNRFEKVKGALFEFYELSRFFRSVGIFGLIMLLYKTGWFKWLFNLMRPVGQMAFTNYLMQSIICGLLFFGVGFGLFGKLQRYELYYVVAVVWIFQIIFSHVWLRHYRFGPLEWLWRSLTYWKKQPMSKS
ncbi:MAG: DUF418 domain-containing protein [Chitinophagaceae bacterium]